MSKSLYCSPAYVQIEFDDTMYGSWNPLSETILPVPVLLHDLQLANPAQELNPQEELVLRDTGIWEAVRFMLEYASSSHQTVYWTRVVTLNEIPFIMVHNPEGGLPVSLKQLSNKCLFALITLSLILSERSCYPPRDSLFACCTALSGDPLMDRRAEQLRQTLRESTVSRFHNLVGRIIQHIWDPIRRKFRPECMSFFRGYSREGMEHLFNNGENECTGYVAKWTENAHEHAQGKDELTCRHATYWFRAQRRYAEVMELELEEYRHRLRVQSEAWVFGELEARNRQVSLPAVETIVDELLDTNEDSS